VGPGAVVDILERRKSLSSASIRIPDHPDHIVVTVPPMPSPKYVGILSA